MNSPTSMSNWKAKANSAVFGGVDGWSLLLKLDEYLPPAHVAESLACCRACCSESLLQGEPGSAGHCAS